MTKSVDNFFTKTYSGQQAMNTFHPSVGEPMTSLQYRTSIAIPKHSNKICLNMFYSKNFRKKYVM